jgi:membrane protein
MGLLKRVVSEFFKDDAMTHAAALAYYGALSLAPLVLILLWIASFVGPTAEKTLVDQAVTAMGEQAGSSIQQVIGGARARPTLANISGAVGLGVLLFSAASVFVQLQHALNRIWDVKPRPAAGIWNTVRCSWGCC